MKVLIQWANKNPGDWEEIDSSDWVALPKRSDPVGGERIDNNPGWINRICVQGVEFTSDHYAVEHLDNGGCRVYSWSDDPEDYLPGYRNAKICEFHPLAPDFNLGGAINTRQTFVHFVESEVAKNMPSSIQNSTITTWKNFVRPFESLIRHGIWMPKGLYDKHERIRKIRGWREWTEGLSPLELNKNGKVKIQRAIGRYNVPDGTRTYYHNNVTLATAIHNVNGGTDERTLGTTVAGASSVTSQNLRGGDTLLVFAATTVAGEPDHAQWPTGNYRCQIDVTSVGLDITYGLLTLGTAAGHFARVNTGLTSDLETKQQVESAFAGTGLKLATTGSVSWSSGAATDRFEILIAAQRAANHGNQSITLQLGETDDFADGPWAAAAVAVENAVFFGHNF